MAVLEGLNFLLGARPWGERCALDVWSSSFQGLRGAPTRLGLFPEYHLLSFRGRRADTMRHGLRDGIQGPRVSDC